MQPLLTANFWKSSRHNRSPDFVCRLLSGKGSKRRKKHFPLRGEASTGNIPLTKKMGLKHWILPQ